MKRTLLEKSFVVVLFVLVMIAFLFAERDTQKLFNRYNKKTTVEMPKQTVDYSASIPGKPPAGKNINRD